MGIDETTDLRCHSQLAVAYRIVDSETGKLAQLASPSSQHAELADKVPACGVKEIVTDRLLSVAEIIRVCSVPMF